MQMEPEGNGPKSWPRLQLKKYMKQVWHVLVYKPAVPPERELSSLSKRKRTIPSLSRLERFPRFQIWLYITVVQVTVTERLYTGENKETFVSKKKKGDYSNEIAITADLSISCF